MTIAHDLRSPLLSIRGCVELLVEQCKGEFDPSEFEILDALKDSINHMEALLEDPPTRFNREVREKQACDVSVVGRNVVGLLAHRITVQGINLQTRIPNTTRQLSTRSWSWPGNPQ